MLLSHSEPALRAWITLPHRLRAGAPFAPLLRFQNLPCDVSMNLRSRLLQGCAFSHAQLSTVTHASPMEAARTNHRLHLHLKARTLCNMGGSHCSSREIPESKDLVKVGAWMEHLAGGDQDGDESSQYRYLLHGGCADLL